MDLEGAAKVARLAEDSETRERLINRRFEDHDESSKELAYAFDPSYGFRTLPGLVRPKGTTL